MDFGQHHVGHRIGEKALLSDRRQLPRIAQHQDRLAEGQKVLGHLFAHHRDLIEHQEIGVAQIGMRVQHELRLVDVIEPEFQLGNLRLGKAPLGRTHPWQVALQRRQFLGHPRDFLGRGFRMAIDQAVNGLRWRAFACHHEDCLAGEGSKEHTTQTTGRHGLKAERFNRQGGDGALPHPCIPEDAENLLVLCSVAIPFADGPNRFSLRL